MFMCLSVLCWWVNRCMGLELGQVVIMPGRFDLNHVVILTVRI
jgi:hypothetical protein